MVRKGDEAEDWPRRRKDDTDPASTVGLAFRILNEQTPIALIALCSLGFLAYLYITTLTAMGQTLRDHVRESGWYQRQSCISLASLAGTPTTACDLEHDNRR